MGCGCGKKKAAVTSVDVAAAEAAERDARNAEDLVASLLQTEQESANPNRTTVR